MSHLPTHLLTRHHFVLHWPCHPFPHGISLCLSRRSNVIWPFGLPLLTFPVSIGLFVRLRPILVVAYDWPLALIIAFGFPTVSFTGLGTRLTYFSEKGMQTKRYRIGENPSTVCKDAKSMQSQQAVSCRPLLSCLHDYFNEHPSIEPLHQQILSTERRCF